MNQCLRRKHSFPISMRDAFGFKLFTQWKDGKRRMDGRDSTAMAGKPVVAPPVDIFFPGFVVARRVSDGGIYVIFLRSTLDVPAVTTSEASDVGPDCTVLFANQRSSKKLVLKNG